MTNQKLQKLFGICPHLEDSASSRFPIQKIFRHSYSAFCKNNAFQSEVQKKAARAVIKCKSGVLGCNVSICTECGHTEIHNNSCRNRNCPNCQAVNKEIWVDNRRAEVIDSPYFHVVFTLPHQLNALLYHNQKLLYGLLHRCSSETLLELCANPKCLSALPGIIQVLHTWNQELDYHVHMHCIISGGGMTADRKLRIYYHQSKEKFFIPVFVLRDKFQGKFLALLEGLYRGGQLVFPSFYDSLKDPASWNTFKNRLYEQEWCPYIKETFNGFGNAIEYLGKYTHRIAISNSRILSVNETEVTFSAGGKNPASQGVPLLLPMKSSYGATLCMYCHLDFRRSATMASLTTEKNQKI